MDTLGRDRRIRIGAGLVMAGLAVLSVIIVLVAGPDPRTDIVPTIIVVVQALLSIGLGTFLAGGKLGAGELVLVPSRWRRAFLLIVVLFSIGAFAWLLLSDPGQVDAIALGPNLVALVIMLQFGPGRHHFRQEEQWTTALSVQDAVDVLKRVFDQPGLVTKVAQTDVWVEIGREWHGDWRHGEAAKHLKQRPRIHFVIDAADKGTRVTAFSKEMQLGMYDVLKLADEMSESGVALARQATFSN